MSLDLLETRLNAGLDALWGKDAWHITDDGRERPVRGTYCAAGASVHPQFARGEGRSLSRGVPGETPTFELATEKAKDMIRGHRLRCHAGTFLIADRQDDGLGWTVLMLAKDVSDNYSQHRWG